MKSITLSSKNQVVIPSAVRAKLGLKGGDRLVVEDVTENTVVLKKEPSFRELIGTLPSQPQAPVQRVRVVRDDWTA